MPTPFDLSGRVAVVTGGNSGIGRGMIRTRVREPLRQSTPASPTPVSAAHARRSSTCRWKGSAASCPRTSTARSSRSMSCDGSRSAAGGTPEDFAGIAVYLASDASAYHSGDEFIVDGGYRIF